MTIKCSCIALVWQNKEVLLLRRHPNCRINPDHWTLPGGKLELDENYYEGGVRELQEETGIVLEALTLMTSTFSISISDSDTDTEIMFFPVEISHKLPVTLSREHTEFKWVPFHAIFGHIPKEAPMTRQFFDSYLLDVEVKTEIISTSHNDVELRTFKL